MREPISVSGATDTTSVAAGVRLGRAALVDPSRDVWCRRVSLGTPTSEYHVRAGTDLRRWDQGAKKQFVLE